MSQHLFRILLQLASLLVAVAVADAQGDAAPRLVRLIDDLGAGTQSAARAANGLTYFITDNGIHVYDPARRISFVVDSSPAVDLTVSPNGDRLAFGRGDPMFAIWSLRVDPSTGRAVAPARRLSLTTGRAPVFSPDGRWVAFSVLPANDTLVGPRIVRVPTSGGPEQVLSREPGYAQRLRWSPDGSWIYYRHGMMTAAGRLRTLHRLAAGGGVPEQLARIGEFVGLSPDGRWLAYVTNVQFHLDTLPKTLVIADARGRQLQRVDLPSDVRPEGWGPAPEQLLFFRAAGRPRSRVRLTNLNGHARELTPDGASEGVAATPSDGKSVWLESFAGERRDIVSLDLASGVRHVVFADAGSEGKLQWHDERFLAFAKSDGTVHVVDRATRRERSLGQCQHILTPLRSDSTVLCLHQAIGVRQILSTNLANGASRVLRSFSVPEQDRPVVVMAGADQVVLGFGGRVMTAPLGDGPQRTVFVASRGEEMMGNDVMASPDGAWLAFFVQAVNAEGRRSEFLRLVSPRTAAVRSLPLPALRLTSSPLWDPAGRYVAVAAEDGPRRDLWVVPLNGARPFALTRAMPDGEDRFTLAGDGSGVLSVSMAGTNSTSVWAVDLSSLLARVAR